MKRITDKKWINISTILIIAVYICVIRLSSDINDQIWFVGIIIELLAVWLYYYFTHDQITRQRIITEAWQNEKEKKNVQT